MNTQLPEPKRKAFALLLESLLALRRENKGVLWSSMVKDTMKRKKPSFNESYHGYRTFSELLEDAAKEGLLELETDKRSRTYVVTRFGSELTGSAAAGGNRREEEEVAPPRGTKKKQPQPAGAETASTPPETNDAPEGHEPGQPDLFDQGDADLPPEPEREDVGFTPAEHEPLAAEPEPRPEPPAPEIP